MLSVVRLRALGDAQPRQHCCEPVLEPGAEHDVLLLPRSLGVLEAQRRERELRVFARGRAFGRPVQAPLAVSPREHRPPAIRCGLIGDRPLAPAALRAFGHERSVEGGAMWCNSVRMRADDYGPMRGRSWSLPGLLPIVPGQRLARPGQCF